MTQRSVEQRHADRPKRAGIGLCLSGGGFRATLFHAGTIIRLNESGLLPRLRTISSVSGGSFAGGALAAVWDRLEPDERGRMGNLESVYIEPLREFCRHDRRTGALVTGRLNPFNWSKLASADHSATDLFSDVLEDHLVGSLQLDHLARIKMNGGPDFLFNACCLQTGVNFVLSGERVGDYQIGYAKQPAIRLADAIAASAAYPLVFPPLVLRFPKGAFVNGRLSGPEQVSIARRVLLTDGGVYDNLGLEPVWKSHAIVLCSDGGKPSQIEPDSGSAIAARVSRTVEIFSDQALSLRKRWLIQQFQTGALGGAYWGLRTDISGYARHREGFRGALLSLFAGVRTDLDAFSDDE